MLITAIYLRKSRAEEKEPAEETLARHREILTGYARDNNLNVVRLYQEIVSGDSLYKRPELLRLMEDLPMYGAVLCMDIDRLGRGAMHEQGLIFDAFRSYGVLIVTPSKTYDMANDTDDSLIGFKALFAREEYKMIRGRLRRGTIKAVQEGCYLSNAPFGYRQTRINKKPTLEIVPHEAEGVRLIFDMYLEGHGCQSIADRLHALGYRPRRGHKFNRTTVAKIIRNPVYTGKVVWNQYRFERPKKPGEKCRKRIKPRSEWLITDGLHQPIITSGVYGEANRKLSGRYHPPYNKGTVKNPLAGILFCSVCGMSMVRRPLKGKRPQQPVLICPTAGCSMSSSLSVATDILFETVNRALAGIKPTEEAPVRHKDMSEAAKAEISRLRQQLGKLHDLLERGVYDEDTFMARRDDLNSRIAEASRLIGTSADVKTGPVRRLDGLLDYFREGTPYEKNLLLKAAVKKAVYVKPKGSGWGTPPVIEIVEWRL